MSKAAEVAEVLQKSADRNSRVLKLANERFNGPTFSLDKQLLQLLARRPVLLHRVSSMIKYKIKREKVDLFYTLLNIDDKIKKNLYTVKLKIGIQSRLQLTTAIKYKTFYATKPLFLF
jgi:hypothetical protein